MMDYAERLQNFLNDVLLRSNELILICVVLLDSECLLLVCSDPQVLCMRVPQCFRLTVRCGGQVLVSYPYACEMK